MAELLWHRQAARMIGVSPGRLSRAIAAGRLTFRYAHEHEVEKGGRYDAPSAAINMWSHYWLNAATRAYEVVDADTDDPAR
jgi:hypothetical protein